MHDPLAAHYRTILKAMLEGRVIPLLGAGVNLCDRPTGVPFQHGRFLPSGGELAAALAQEAEYTPDGQEVECPHCHESHRVQYPLDLLKVSQHMAVMAGSGPLYEELRRVFNADYPPTSLHEYFATLPSVIRGTGATPKYQLIVTTNYDDVLERAFDAADEQYDLVSYMADGDHRGKFLHRSPDGVSRVVETANDYAAVSTEKRTVIMKIHGAVDRAAAERDSYVITEDHYIDFLAHSDISGLIPVLLNMKMRKSHFLFLGYSLRDWNLRVILHRIWGERKLSYQSWAIQLDPQRLDFLFWLKRDVEILPLPLEKYIKGLKANLPAILESWVKVADK